MPRPINIFVDVDGTLQDYEDNLNRDLVDLLTDITKVINVKLYVWSGGGQEYAQKRVEQLGIAALFERAYPKYMKLDIPIDIAIDDYETSLGLVNLMVTWPGKEG